MPQEQDEALNEGNLHHDVAKPDGYKIKQRQRRMPRLPALQRQRKNQKQEHRDRRNPEHQQQNEYSQVYLPVNTLAHARLAQNLRRLQREKKERSVVRDR